MNISQPVASSIGSVEFSFLSSAEIRTLSVKRITSPTAFDALLHPVPGGLYDPALGTFLDNPCSTCHLAHGCPGHCGHVELPGPVYHPMFMDQCLRLLRAKCVYCHRLRLPRVEINRYACQLRLIGRGLLTDSYRVTQLGLSFNKRNDEDASSSDEEQESSSIIREQNAYVERALKNTRARQRNVELHGDHHEALSDARRRVIREFLVEISTSRRCPSCNGISPTYRKDNFTKIFKKPLGKKDRAAMIQAGFKAQNPLLLLQARHKAASKPRPNGVHVDEGVADLDMSSLDEEVEDVEMMDADSIVAGESMVDVDSSISKNGTGSRAVEPQQEYMGSGEVHAALTQLFEKENEIFGLVYGSQCRSSSHSGLSADMFFIKDIIVPPSRYRPEARTGDDAIAEAAQNSLYRQILTTCDTMYQITKEMKGIPPVTESQRVRDFQDLQNAWIRLQDAVNSLIDRDRNPIQGAAGKRNADGIKQVLEKKEGLFRKNMMGKRVNFAARSVISPDPNIATNEIGIPPVFAMKLSYPEPVTNHNFHDLKEAVINGPHKWPGALAVETEIGNVINLRRKNAEERMALANQLLAPSSTNMKGARNKKVHRHLLNGDIVIMNRQPTLHKPSMMAHRARVLAGEKTIRMHYANCNTYNADFDGDEMNLHFPQNELARSEALQIADTDHQYLSGTAGNPLRGLIQDHISMGVWITSRDCTFTKEEYHQLLYACLRPENEDISHDKISTVPPAILKPQTLWTGKQVVTTILKNIKPASHAGLTLTSKASTSADLWGNDFAEEGVVYFNDGELLHGILDKKQIGPSAGGFVHSVYEAYGHSIAGKLLSILSRVLTELLHMRAFSCGVEDLVLTKDGDLTREHILKDADSLGVQVAAKYVSLQDKAPRARDPELCTRLEDVLRDDTKLVGLDRVTTNQTKLLSSRITKACLPLGLYKPFPKNQMQTMTNSGAKGSAVNAGFISCNLGQQELEGRRVPTMVSGKTLPCFGAFDPGVRAGGYVVDRFLTGVRPQEYYFHAMAGRVGLIDTAVKTSRSGYLQRCLVKGMEGLKVEYDTSIRDADGSMIQFLYGEDGLDITKQKALTNFKFMAENFLSFYASLGVRDEFEDLQSKEPNEWNKSAYKKVRRTGNIAVMDTAMSRFPPSRFLGSTSEKFFAALKQYCDEDKDRVIKSKKQPGIGTLKRRFLESVLHAKYLKSIVEAGEAVGIVAAQSVGEPSTQMTLNTFHLAGHSAKNVTLGIPRLREILMTASQNVATPEMTLYLNPELTQQQGDTFAKAITRLSLAEVIDDVTVGESIGNGILYEEAKIYHIRLDLFPSDEYTSGYAIKVDDIIRTLERKFCPALQDVLKRELKKRGDERMLTSRSDAVPEVGISSRRDKDIISRPEGEQEGGESDLDDDGDDDATNTKQRANQNENITYEAPDDDEEPRLAQAMIEESPDEDDSTYGGSRPQRSHSRSEEDEDEEAKIKRTWRNDAVEREARIMKDCKSIASFAFDESTGSTCTITVETGASTPRILMLPMVEKAAKAALIQSVSKIKLCTMFKPDSQTDKPVEHPFVFTEGSNLLAVREYQDIIDPNKISTNDIYAMGETYGIEACRASIIRELHLVFSAYGIEVDQRHLNLIADFMTRGGDYKPFNRLGLRGNVSPLMKMSFETTATFLRDAVLDGVEFGGKDDLRNPSARIVVGKVCNVGTGVFDVLMPLV